MRLATRIHGMLDYVLAALMIAAPFVLGYPEGTGAAAASIAAGVALAGYSLATDYELGAVRRLPVPLHLLLDGVIGILLAVSPWMFGFDQQVWIPHAVLGLVTAVAAAVTNTLPGYDRRRAAH